MNRAYANNTLEVERDYHRSLDLGYSLDDSLGFLKCVEHGAPHPLIRWHHHKEYELHLITASSGKMFVGDYIGEFQTGNLVLTGPYLPHNWVSDEIPEEGIPSRDLSVQFLDRPFRKACELLPEMSEILPLLNRAKYGIEFFGISDYAKQQLLKIKNKEGVFAFNEFLILISILSKHSDYQLLSGVQFEHTKNKEMDKFSHIIDFITKNFSAQFSMAEIAAQNDMESSSFSRHFKKATGLTFTGFVNRLRISRASQLLSNTDMYISTIGYHVGYNNVANFNRRFIEINKITPSEYRRQSYSKY